MIERKDEIKIREIYESKTERERWIKWKIRKEIGMKEKYNSEEKCKEYIQRKKKRKKERIMLKIKEIM